MVVVGSIPLLLVFSLVVVVVLGVVVGVVVVVLFVVGRLEFFESVFDDGDASGVFLGHGADDVFDGFCFVGVVVDHDGVDFLCRLVFVSVLD